MYKTLIILTLLFFSCSTTKYYVVRHAEKEEATTMTSDVALSEKGKKRAEVLKQVLLKEKIAVIYATRYIRTKSTVEPLAQALKLDVLTYQPMDTTFFQQLRTSKNNILIAGHSNTVDNIVNALLGYKAMQDLPETQYGDLFIIKRKGSKFSLEKKQF